MPTDLAPDPELEPTTMRSPLAPLESIPTRAGQSALARGPDELERVHLASRYLLGEKLGAGGMGVVIEAYDPRMRREIAIKRPLPNRDDGGRILAEARIQSALEHPAIVPVYEVGRDQDGRAYFTMRRLEGTALADVLKEPDAARDSIVAPRWSLSRLLRAFVDVCMAVEYAHSRGFLHCDLKPGNVLFGEFGEVYVLDWGTARRFRANSDPDLEVTSRPRVAEGTPAYMAPEQFRGDAVLGPACDVFSLGALLFEILVGQPLHARRAAALQIEALYESGELDASPISRAPDRGISPELDWLCQVAMRVDPSERLASARQLADGVQAFLDGDRDVARRRTIAAEHVREAEELLESYEANPSYASVRAAAFRESARALSYDPTHEVARDLVTRLLFEAPETIPEEVVAEVTRQESHVGRRQAELVIAAYATLLAMLPLFTFGGVREPVLLGVIVALALALIANAVAIRRRPMQTLPAVVVRSLGDALLVGLLASVFGPFGLPPALAVMASLLHVGSPFLTRQWVVPACHMVAPLLPIALVLGGWFQGFEVTREAIRVPAELTWFDPTFTTIGLYLFPPVVLVLSSFVRARTVAANREELLRHELQRWHLQQIVDVERRSRPDDFGSGAPDTVRPPPPR